MEIHIIKKLERVERLGGVNLEAEKVLIPYKRFNQTWIKADTPIMNLYAKNLKTSELQFYPNKSLKAWAIFSLNILKGRKNKQSLRSLLGIRIAWRFLEKVVFPFRADIIYIRQHACIMVYVEEKRVIKVALTNRGTRDINNELESQRLVRSIPSKDIFIPSIIREFRNEDLDFTVEDYFEGKRQSFKDRSLLEANYRKVFQFLLEFYLKNPIELQNLSESRFLNHEFVEEFIRKRKDGGEVISIFKKLYAKEKKMIMCRIHGDLNHNNILSNKEQVCIIDWGKSKHHYLARDLDNSSFNTECVFDELVERAHIDKQIIYSYKEQLFLGRYIEMNRLIYNGIVRKTITPSLYTWTEKQNLQLKKMGDKLS